MPSHQVGSLGVVAAEGFLATRRPDSCSPACPARSGRWSRWLALIALTLQLSMNQAPLSIPRFVKADSSGICQRYRSVRVIMAVYLLCLPGAVVHWPPASPSPPRVDMSKQAGGQADDLPPCSCAAGPAWQQVSKGAVLPRPGNGPMPSWMGMLGHPRPP